MSEHFDDKGAVPVIDLDKGMETFGNNSQLFCEML